MRVKEITEIFGISQQTLNNWKNSETQKADLDIFLRALDYEQVKKIIEGLKEAKNLKVGS